LAGAWTVPNSHSNEQRSQSRKIKPGPNPIKEIPEKVYAMLKFMSDFSQCCKLGNWNLTNILQIINTKGIF